MSRALAYRTGLALALLCAFASPAAANWVASGTFLYQDRDWDQNGFTGAITDKPIRFADVEVIDPNKSGAKRTLARGKTDANGAYSITVVDSSTRSVAVRVLTQTTQTPDLFVKVTTQGNSIYAGTSSTIPGHNPNTNVNFGTLVAQAFGGAEAFNILDLGIYGADFIKALTGSRPNSSKLVTFKWQSNGGIAVSFTSGNVVTLRDSAGYDDTVIEHEWSHYIMTTNYSRSSNPGGTHFLSDCNEDLRLAFDEARASFFGNSVRRYFGMPNPDWYIRTDGASGPGHVQNAYNLESALQYPCQGDTSEVSVSRTLWDIGDGPSTTDGTPGVDDNPPDALVLPDLETWQVFNGPMRTGTRPVSHELFWDSWFDPTVANAFKTEMTSIFDAYTIRLYPDASEPNDSTGSAILIASNGGTLSLTYFSDPDGNGMGQADTDYFTFNAVSGVTYTVQTLNLLSDGNTNLELIDTNGTSVLASNNDRVAGDPSSLITWTAPRSDLFYIRSTHATDTGIYGSYDLSLTNP